MSVQSSGLTRLLAANAFWLLVEHVLSRGSLMLAVIVLARTVATEAFASYVYFQATIHLVAAYASMGLGVTASRYFAELRYEPKGQPTFPLGTLWGLSLVMALLGGVAVLSVPDQWLLAGLEFPRGLMALGVIVAIGQIVPGGAVIGLGLYRQSALVSLVVAIIMLSGTWFAVVQGAVSVAMGALVLAFAVQLLGLSALVLRRVGGQTVLRSLGWKAVHIRRVMQFAGPMFLVSVLAASGGWLVGRIILELSGARSFALYTIGMQWFALALLVPGVLARVVLPAFVRGASTATGQGDGRLMRNAVRLSIGAGLLVGCLAVALGPWLIGIYGERYDAGRWFIAAFVGAAVLTAPSHILGNAIVARDGQRHWLGISAVWLIILVLTGLLTTGLGAWSGALAQASASAVLLVLAHRHAGRIWREQKC